jgi:dihydrofolate reductase
LWQQKVELGGLKGDTNTVRAGNCCNVEIAPLGAHSKVPGVSSRFTKGEAAGLVEKPNESAAQSGKIDVPGWDTSQLEILAEIVFPLEKCRVKEFPGQRKYGSALQLAIGQEILKKGLEGRKWNGHSCGLFYFKLHFEVSNVNKRVKCYAMGMDKPRVSIIVAIAKNGVIGSTKTNSLLWSIPEDFKHFKDITMGHPIIMGRKTFQSIGRPLPGRTSIVISSDPKPVHPDAIMADSLEDALAKAAKLDQKEVFIIGGGQIYSMSLPFTDRIYATVVDIAPEGDVFFPDYSMFSKVISKRESKDENYSYTFYELEK